MIDARIFNFHDVLLFITIAECLLLALYRISVRHVASVVLAAFLTVVAIDSFTALIMWNDLFPVTPVIRESFIPYLFIVSQLAAGPLFFLYIRSLTDAKFYLKKNQLIHFVPALLAALTIAIWSISTTDLRMISEDPHKIFVGRVLWYFAILISISYVFAAMIAIRHYHIQLKENYSEFSIIDLGWLSILTIGFLISWSWSLLVVIIADTAGGAVASHFGEARHYIRFLLLNALFIYSFVYTHRQLAQQLSIAKENEGDTSGSQVLEKIIAGINEQKLHLEPNINIDEFSARINLPTKVVSYAINRELQTKFFEFINSYRIEVAKSLLADKEKADLSILDILLMSGFSNKSSFHRFFKRIVNMSPTEYRRRALSDTPPTPHAVPSQDTKC